MADGTTRPETGGASRSAGPNVGNVVEENAPRDGVANRDDGEPMEAHQPGSTTTAAPPPAPTGNDGATALPPQPHPAGIMGLSGRSISLATLRGMAGRDLDWYEGLHPADRRDLGFWRADMMPDRTPRQEVVPGQVPTAYSYRHFASYPLIPGTVQVTWAGPSGPLPERELHTMVQETQDEFRRLNLAPGPDGTAPIVPPETVRRLSDVDVALYHMAKEHDKRVLQSSEPRGHIATPRPGNPPGGFRLSPYAGPAPAPAPTPAPASRGLASYMSGPFSTYQRPLHDVVPEHPATQHIMDTLQSTVLTVNPNASNRPISTEEPPDETPLPRATPIRFSHFSMPNQALTPSATYFNSRHLMPERNPLGAQGLGPYWRHLAEQDFHGPVVAENDGPFWLGRDQVLNARYPWPQAPAPVVVPRVRRGRGTDRAGYTRRRAPNRMPPLSAMNRLTGPPSTRGNGRGNGRGRGGGGDGTRRPRGRPRLQR